MKRLLGESFGFVKSGLTPSLAQTVNVNVTDTLGKIFTNQGRISIKIKQMNKIIVLFCLFLDNQNYEYLTYENIQGEVQYRRKFFLQKFSDIGHFWRY